jgi:hypothetical protein
MPVPDQPCVSRMCRQTLLFSWSVQMLNILQAFCVSKGRS